MAAAKKKLKQTLYQIFFHTDRLHAVVCFLGTFDLLLDEAMALPGQREVPSCPAKVVGHVTDEAVKKDPVAFIEVVLAILV